MKRFSKTEEKALRDLARTKLDLPKNATMKRIVSVLNRQTVNEANFYTQMERFRRYEIKKERQRNAELQAQRWADEIARKNAERRQKQFMLLLTLSIVFKNKDKDGNVKISRPYIVDNLEGPYKTFAGQIPSIVATFNEETNYKIVTVIRHKVEYMNDRILKLKKRDKTKQMMKRSFILKNNWLQHAESICKEAYEPTDDRCVDYQLAKFLNDPPVGKPTKFIKKGLRVTEDNLYEYFQSLITECDISAEDYPDFKINSGRSTEMIRKLCMRLNRSMYAYDANDKCFSSYVCTDANYNYCPIVFYKANGNFYLIDNKTSMKSCIEKNKSTSKNIIASSVTNDEKKEKALDVYHIDIFDIENAKQLKTGIYLLQQSNISVETIQFITFYKETPYTRNRENVIIQFTYKNIDNEPVVIACDANYGKQIDYVKLKNVAETNSMNYINQGVGSVILHILTRKDERTTFTSQERCEMLMQCEGKCMMCNMDCEKTFQIDHIKPLASGGTNSRNNLQVLCIDCHKEKTIEENELGLYHVQDEISSHFNDIVIHEVVSIFHFQAHQFVEKLADLPETETAFKTDMKRLRH